MGKKKTFYVFSDVHSFYDEFIEALEKSGYREDDPNAILVSLGDNFDRGPKSQEMLNWLNNHPSCIITKSNHDLLMQEMFYRGYYETHDVHNQSVKTVLDLAGVQYKRITYWGIEDVAAEEWEDACKTAKEKLQPIYNRVINYFETKNYIMAHSWIPTKYEINKDQSFSDDLSVCGYADLVYDPEWREAGDLSWSEAVWCNPFKMAKMGLNKTGKTIICGHWATSQAYGSDKIKELEKQGIWDYDGDEINWGSEANHNIYYGDGIIGLDATTAISHKINILVIEDELLEED